MTLKLRIAIALACALAPAETLKAVDVLRLPAATQRPVDFVKDIQPIFERSCVKCHGAEKQKGGYRLDVKSIALTGGDHSAPNVHPRDSAASPLIHFVAGLDPDTKMPAKGDPLTTEEIALLRAWIDQGAPWPEDAGTKVADRRDWWSFHPLTRPQPPANGNPIDVFIQAKLKDKGLTPSPEADARTLIRRMYFDLIGLPPTPEECDAFVEASSRDRKAAFEALVDRLLASPHYGERWARHWLDVAHYGDTHGFDKDQPRPNAWPYRDYVVRTLNDDKPYARFVQEQIAGDALFPGSADGIIALGFIAAGPWDLISHAEVPETKVDGQIARNLDRDDMVTNTLGSFCSLTVQCARCHNHKFDPVAQEDYYRLQAVFAAVDRADRPYDRDPAVAKAREELEQRKHGLSATQQTLAAKVAKLGGAELAAIDRLIADASKSQKSDPVAQPDVHPQFGYHSQIASKQDEVKWVQVDLGAPMAVSSVLLAPCFDNFNNIGAGFGFPVRFKIECSDDATFASGVTEFDKQTQADFPNPGIAPRLIDAGKAVARYVRVTATKLAPRRDDYIFAIAELEIRDTAGKNIAFGKTVTALDSIQAEPRWAKANLVDGLYPAAPKESKASPAQRREQRAALIARLVDEPTREALARSELEIAEVDAALGKLPAPQLVYAAGIYNGSGNFRGTGPDGGRARPIHVLARGDVRQPGVEVSPGAVALIDGIPGVFDLPAGASESARRAALARWITDERNPLTWRSIVNRVWQYHFGRGLVETPNDFGHMGQQPSHPELLDWLACEFRDSGGSLKHLHRLIVTSATYQQSSAGNAAAQKIDAGNALLWRMNRRKLDAECLRDSILAVSGKLDLTIGGEPFRDFVVERPEHSPHYEYRLHDADDPKSHRRSIYRFLVRSQPEPFMSALDCADPSMSVGRRNETLTALQALALLNDKLTVTMARHFSVVVAQNKTPVREAFRRALSRDPNPDELAALETYAAQHTLANTCRLLFNLNEFAFVD